MAKIRIDPYVEALTLAKATIKSGKNFQYTIDELIDNFINGKFLYKNNHNIYKFVNKKRMAVYIDEDKYSILKEHVEKHYGSCRHKAVINFLLINYLEHN